MPATLICPKCKSEMKRYERNGVIVDQCIECRGMFLDRGEFEQLMGAESALYGKSLRGNGPKERPVPG
jgi:Zn-finger nucleic acid-binding protein